MFDVTFPQAIMFGCLFFAAAWVLTTMIRRTDPQRGPIYETQGERMRRERR